MTVNWPPLDAHAHIDPTIAPRGLLELRAVVFAASRTLDESATALNRQHEDFLAVWGVGTHPAVTAALDSYDSGRFSDLVARTAYVSEVGLDGRTKARLPRQIQVLTSILEILQQHPRITSLHSYNATGQLVELLQQTPIKGAVLHWWLGDHTLTKRALEFGAHFSVNASNLKNTDALNAIPLERLITETDHPDGNRRTPQPRQPGNVAKVEAALAQRHGLSPQAFRQQCWTNLSNLSAAVGCSSLLPPRVQTILAAAKVNETP